MNKKRFAVFTGILLFLNISIFAQFITVKKDANGWRLMEDRKEIEVKGIVWSYTPIGETHTYDLWSKSDEFIERMIDTDMPMLKAMGVNAIRCFSDIPPKWVEYIYTKYGIYTIVNNLLGRYGVAVNGTWYANTDYSDLYTRETLVEMAVETAEKYRAVNGVLMYMFGNESNYGLVWSGSEIENLPVGEQNTVKAGYLYSLLEEAMAACKDIDPFHPVGIVNGDTQYLELIKELCPSLDILGVNAYRGFRFYDSFYENVAEVLDKPIMFTEAGADAYNEITHQEDQYAQMAYLMSQWKEIYQQGYGKGRSQNVIGGFVFEWMDEWWKHYQNKDLELHNDTGTWSNSGYELDYRDGLNNMDEEWFGICAQSKLTDRGINKRIPRASYYLLQDIWKLSLYKSSESDINKTFASLNTSMYLAQGNEKSIKEMINENKLVQIDTLDATVQVTTPMYVNRVWGAIKDNGHLKESFEYQNAKGENVKTTVTAETTLGLTVKPMENLSGTAVIKAWTDSPYTNLGDRWASYYKDGPDYSTTQPEAELKYVDFYSASLNYSGNLFDINGYYHVGHASFENTGDIFNISKEAFDIIGYDTYGSKAPIALEFVGKNLLEGLTVIGGPEIWGSAKPQVQANYFRWFPTESLFVPDFTIGLVYAEEFGAKSSPSLDPYNAYGAGRKASIYAAAVLDPWVTLKLGVLHAGSEKVGAKYIDQNGNSSKITYLDTLGGYVQLGTNMFQHMYIYGNAIYRGLVADTNPAEVRGSFFTADSGAGNRFEAQVGVDVGYGDFVFKPVVRARVPLQQPKGRDLLTGSPFIVGLGNRQAIEVEAVLTYDPEGATWFHEWNGDDIEGAKFAFSLTGMYTLYAGKTDNLPFKSNTWTSVTNETTAKYSNMIWYNGGALPEQRNLWQVGTRIVTNPLPGLRIIATADGGCLGALTGAYQGDYPELVQFVNAGLAVRYNHWIGSTKWSFNTWGPESWWRNFNQTFPLQFSFDIAYGFGDNPSFLDAKNRIGLSIIGRKFGKYSSDAYNALPNGAVVDGSAYVEITTYVNIGL
ncbi:hypothetical protein [Treponema bryantii]|uniref:hypothetical protein n=1 Tax=Treponema bryantii TaxID=163 RepID=UPI002B302FD3|nr:hypothetical protein TRBR_04650 [Treponema bryantii]